jgi:ABC-2 type transport system permease protein
MQKVWVVARNDLQMTLRDRKNWLLLAALPVLIIYLAGVGAQEVAQLVPATICVDVLDEDNSAPSQALAAAMADTNTTLLICPARDDTDDACGLGGALLSPSLARQRLLDDTTLATLVIPEGFATALGEGEDVSLVLQTKGASAASEIVFGALESASADVGGPVVAARLSTAMAESLDIEAGPAFYADRRAEAEATWGRTPLVRITAASHRRSEALIMGTQVLENGFKLSTPSIVVMFVMVSILGMTQSLAEERLTGVLPRMGMMPVSKAQWLGGKLLSTYLLGCLQWATLLLFGTLLGVHLARTPLAALIVGSSYVLAVTAMALALGTLAGTPQQATSLATAAYILLAPLGGAWWPLAFVPPWLRTLGHLSPIAWCLDGLNALIFYGGTLGDVLEPTIALLLFATVLFLIGVRGFDYRQSTAKGAASRLPYV